MFESVLSSGISLSRLHTFLRVAEAGSIVKAAGQTDANKQSLFSRQIRELEEFFGTELTERRGKSIAISPSGVRLASLIRAHFSALDDFQREQRGHRRSFALGAEASTLEWLICPKMPELLKLLPNSTLRLAAFKSHDLVERVRDGCLDFAIVREDAVPETQRKTTCRRLTKAGMSLAVPMSLAKAAELGTKPKLAELSRLPLAIQASGGCLHQLMQQAVDESGVALQPTVECESFLQVQTVVESGACAGILPAFMATKLDPRRFAVIHLPSLSSDVQGLVLHWNKRQTDRRAVPRSTLKAITRVLTMGEHL